MGQGGERLALIPSSRNINPTLPNLGLVIPRYDPVVPRRPKIIADLQGSQWSQELASVHGCPKVSQERLMVSRTCTRHVQFQGVWGGVERSQERQAVQSLFFLLPTISYHIQGMAKLVQRYNTTE